MDTISISLFVLVVITIQHAKSMVGDYVNPAPLDYP